MYRILAPLLLCSSQAFAASLNVPLTGSALAIESPCARHVEITPDATLHNQITLQATADHPEEINGLILKARDNARIRTHDDRCYRTGLFNNEPTLTMTVHVPLNFPISIDEGGAGTYHIGPVGGPLDLDLSGATSLTADSAAKLDIDLSGAGNVELGQVQGITTLSLSGTGRINIANASIPSLTAEISGAGAITVRAGQIGHVKLENSGFGSATFATTTTDAQIDISGAGSVHFNKLTGQLTKEISGVGTVTVGE